MADLVDKLGRAVLQRDENLREKSKAQAGRQLGDDVFSFENASFPEASESSKDTAFQ